MGRRAAAAASSQAGAVEEESDPIGDVADILGVQYGDEATDEELKAAIHAAIDAL